ncbi:MAG: outer membrane protein assembly factor BamB [Hahellaceae bacterium]|nr:outer membrane protein assembly factor BamB [Hahellaceae bacterium]
MRLWPSGIIWLLLAWFLAGCSSNEVKDEPMDLPDFKSEIKLKEVWSRSIGDGYDELLLFIEPVIQGDEIYAIDLEGELTALNRLNGKRLWRRSLDEPILGGIGADSTHLFVTNRKGELIALSITDGTELWRKSVSSEVLAAPQSDGVRVVVSTIDGNVFCFDTTTAELLWRYDTETPVLTMRGNATPLIAGDSALTGLANGELVALDIKSGAPRWEFPVGVAQGRTELERLVDVDGQPRIFDNRIFAISYQGRLVVIDAFTGQEVWSKKESSYRSLDLGLGQIYVSTSDGEVVAYNLTNGIEIWRQSNIKFRRLSAPKAWGSVVAVGDYEGYLHILSQIDGHFMARTDVDSDGIRAHMIVSDDLLYVYGNGGELAAFRIQN